MKLRLKVLFPTAGAMLLFLSMTGYAHGKSSNYLLTNATVPVAPTYSMMGNASIPTPSTAAEYLEAYATAIEAVLDEDEGGGDGFCYRCWICYLACVAPQQHSHSHWNNCNGEVCVCINSPPYSGCLDGPPPPQ